MDLDLIIGFVMFFIFVFSYAAYLNKKEREVLIMERDKAYKDFLDKAKIINIETAFNEGYARGYHNAERLYNKRN